jgi:hypothetical protein
VSELPVPKATRLQRPRWRDGRLLVGVLLVLASVVLGSVVVSTADDRVPMYVARSALVPGQPVGEADLARVDVQLGASTGRYLSARQAVGPSRFVLRAVQAGELVPAAAVGDQRSVAVQPLTLVVDAGSAAALQVGSQVDVYANTPAAGSGAGATTFAGPELVLQRASVSSLPQGDGGLGGGTGGGRPVQVMVPTDRVKDIIARVDQGARVTVVPVAGTVLRVDR